MKRKTSNTRNQKAVIEYLKKHPMSRAVDIVKGTGLKTNIYSVLINLMEGKRVLKIQQRYTLPATTQNINSPKREIKNKLDLSEDPRMPLFSPRNPDPLANIYRKEIAHIQSGIDQLVITKNYLERRVEEIENAD